MPAKDFFKQISVEVGLKGHLEMECGLNKLMKGFISTYHSGRMPKKVIADTKLKSLEVKVFFFKSFTETERNVGEDYFVSHSKLICHENVKFV